MADLRPAVGRHLALRPPREHRRCLRFIAPLCKARCVDGAQRCLGQRLPAGASWTPLGPGEPDLHPPASSPPVQSKTHARAWTVKTSPKVHLDRDARSKGPKAPELQEPHMLGLRIPPERHWKAHELLKAHLERSAWAAERLRLTKLHGDPASAHRHPHARSASVLPLLSGVVDQDANLYVPRCARRCTPHWRHPPVLLSSSSQKVPSPSTCCTFLVAMACKDRWRPSRRSLRRTPSMAASRSSRSACGRPSPCPGTRPSRVRRVARREEYGRRAHATPAPPPPPTRH